MDRSFSGRVAFITGASGGIGQALARRLAAEGAVLGLRYGAHRQAAEALAAEITSAGGRAIAVGADLRRSEARSARPGGRRPAGAGECAGQQRRAEPRPAAGGRHRRPVR